ncbi:hypothetical protein AYO38_00695 [bacterium SCGC AG-212-C10]|nr:hypothetical protein AYO38_00695 [bacterium SCGC AG-212-C10]
MNARIGHLTYNVRAANLPFYTNLLTFLELPTIYADDTMVGVAGKGGESLWFGTDGKDLANDYDGPGVNHLAFATETQGEVDLAVEYLKAQGIHGLFGTPCHRPDFPGEEGETYYQVMFESPDRILFEIVYTGPKS